jgi:hypothetical protein
MRERCAKTRAAEYEKQLHHRWHRLQSGRPPGATQAGSAVQWSGHLARRYSHHVYVILQCMAKPHRLRLYTGSPPLPGSTHRRPKHCVARQSPRRASSRNGTLKLPATRRRPVCTHPRRWNSADGCRNLAPAIQDSEGFRVRMAQFPPITSGKHRETKTFAAIMRETIGFLD